MYACDGMIKCKKGLSRKGYASRKFSGKHRSCYIEMKTVLFLDFEIVLQLDNYCLALTVNIHSYSNELRLRAFFNQNTEIREH